MSLHNDIMNLPCTPPADANINQQLSYKYGHRDARHAAAELVAQLDADKVDAQDYDAFVAHMNRTYGFCNWQCIDAWDAGKKAAQPDPALPTETESRL